MLEAIVAIGLLAIAFLPLLQLQGQFVGTIDAIERAQGRVEARDLAAKVARIVNFDAQPSGEMVLGERRVRWTSTVAAPAARVRAMEGVPGRFTVTLYDVAFRIDSTEAPDSPPVPIQTRGLGWTPVTSVIDSL